YPGAVVIVTHSEALLREVVDRLVIFNGNNANYFLGSYDDFLEKIGWEEERTNQTHSEPQKRGLTKKEAHAQRHIIIKERSQICNPLIKQLEKLESQVMELEQQIVQYQAILELGTQEQDGQKVLESSKRIGELEDQVGQLFEQMGELEQQ